MIQCVIAKFRSIDAPSCLMCTMLAEWKWKFVCSVNDVAVKVEKLPSQLAHKHSPCARSPEKIAEIQSHWGVFFLSAKIYATVFVVSLGDGNIHKLPVPIQNWPIGDLDKRTKSNKIGASARAHDWCELHSHRFWVCHNINDKIRPSSENARGFFLTNKYPPDWLFRCNALLIMARSHTEPCVHFLKVDMEIAIKLVNFSRLCPIPALTDGMERGKRCL